MDLYEVLITKNLKEIHQILGVRTKSTSWSTSNCQIEVSWL